MSLRVSVFVACNCVRGTCNFLNSTSPAKVTQRGGLFYDPSGAKVNAVTPTIPKAEYGPVHLLVLAQGIILMHYHTNVFL